MLMKKVLMVMGASLLMACGTTSGSTNAQGEIETEESNGTESSRVVETPSLEINGSVDEMNDTEEVQDEVVELNVTEEIEQEENLTVEHNETAIVEVNIDVNITVLEQNSSDIVEDINYTDEELTLSAYDRYITNNRSNASAKIVSLLFKGALPVKDGFAIIQENHEFSFELSWENSVYAENVNYYFFNGTQRSIAYWTLPLPSNSNSYTSTCQALSNYRFKCEGLILDESKNYEGRTMPVSTSFVMAVCDRSTRDPNRICDFIRIPIELRK